MNDIITAEFRDINTITTEIKMLQRQTERLVLEYAIEVGRRLCEAKELMEHGEWGKWLKEEVSFSQSTANNLMKIYNEYGNAQGCIFGAQANSQALGNLSYTKALSLLALPENEREGFVKEHDVENISTRELDRLIKEKESAERKLSDTQHELDKVKCDSLENENKLTAQLEAAKKAKEKAENELNNAAKNFERANNAKKKLEEQVKQLKENPEIPQKTIDKLRTEAESASAEELEKARMALKEASEREEALRKQVQLSNPDTAVFKELYELVQTDFNRLSGCLLKIKNSSPETASKLTVAIKEMLKKMEEKIDK